MAAEIYVSTLRASAWLLLYVVDSQLDKFEMQLTLQRYL